MNCRHCYKPLEHEFLDLGSAPPSNAYLTADDLSKPELYYPLRVFVCEHCWLVQTEDFATSEELFGCDYAYFSSTSKSWLQHAKDYVEMITTRLSLNTNSKVVEIASNDGYLLKNFVRKKISCLGIEPTASTSAAAKKLNIPVYEEFFDSKFAEKLVQKEGQADLIIGNNVYAHVPDINGFTNGMTTLLSPEGTVNLEFPHLLELVKDCLFDTIYHEHYSYLSLTTVSKIFASAGLRIYDVEKLSSHGG